MNQIVNRNHNTRSPELFPQRDVFPNMTNWMNDFFSSSWPFPSTANRTCLTCAPPMNLAETGENYEIELDMAGFDDDEITVEVDGNMINISAESSAEHEEEDQAKTYYLQERSHQSMSRRVQLPTDADMDNAESFYEKGVVKIVIPKTEDAKRQKRTLELKSDD